MSRLFFYALVIALPLIAEQSVVLRASSDSLCQGDGELGEHADCKDGTSFYFTDDKQCNCLRSDQFFPLSECSQPMSCQEGLTFKQIYRFQNPALDNPGKEAAGCGCFLVDAEEEWNF